MFKLVKQVSILGCVAAVMTVAVKAQTPQVPAAQATTPQVTIPTANVPQISLKPYGYVKLDAIYDTHSVVPGDLMFYALPHKNGVDDDKFRMTARETRIGMDINVSDVYDIKTSGKIEVDFYGSGGGDNTPTLRLRLAYVDLAAPNGFSIRAGQDWDTFITVIPRIVNFSYLADAGALGLRRPQVRATQEIKLAERTKLIAKLAAARTIGQDIDGGGDDDGVDSGLPTLQGNLILETPLWTERAAKASISGHLGRETCDKVDEDGNVIANDDKNYDTWSVIGSLYLPVMKYVALQGVVWQGENLDTYFGGIGQGINKQKETAIAAKGGFAQVLFDLTEKLNINVGYGIDDPDDKDLNPNNRSKNEIIFTSLFYKLTSAATLALEYSNIKTSYKDADSAKNNRFQGAVIYRF